MNRDFVRHYTNKDGLIKISILDTTLRRRTGKKKNQSLVVMLVKLCYHLILRSIRRLEEHQNRLKKKKKGAIDKYQHRTSKKRSNWYLIEAVATSEHKDEAVDGEGRANSGERKIRTYEHKEVEEKGPGGHG